MARTLKPWEDALLAARPTCLLVRGEDGAWYPGGWKHHAREIHKLVGDGLMAVKAAHTVELTMAGADEVERILAKVPKAVREANGLMRLEHELRERIAKLESVAREVVYQLSDDGPGNLDEVLDLARDVLGDAREGSGRG